MAGAARQVRIPRRPTLHYERQFWDRGHDVVAGADEAGRGAWAGPLVAAAVALPRSGRQRALLNRRLTASGLEIRDSKQLNPAQREAIVRIIREHHVPCAVVEAPSNWIDRVGLGEANRMALKLALSSVVPQATAGLVDAFVLDELEIEHLSLVKGDQRSLSVALSSIVAKVHRDRWMVECDRRYPGYDFITNKGYGTVTHRSGLIRLGACDIHRRCFAPIESALNGG